MSHFWSLSNTVRVPGVCGVLRFSASCCICLMNAHLQIMMMIAFINLQDTSDLSKLSSTLFYGCLPASLFCGAVLQPTTKNMQWSIHPFIPHPFKSFAGPYVYLLRFCLIPLSGRGRRNLWTDTYPLTKYCQISPLGFSFCVCR